MPSTSKRQHNFMAAVASNPTFAKKAGVPQSVGREFTAADKGRAFAKGGEMPESKKMMGKELAFMKAKKAPKAMIQHEKAEMMGMKKGGVAPSKMAPVKSGGIKKHGEHAVQKSGFTRGKNVGTAGKTVGIEGGARTGKRAFAADSVKMKRGGRC